MNAFLITDKDGATALSEDLRERLIGVLSGGGYNVEVIDLSASDAAPCRGCLLCLTKHPGKCVSQDLVAELAWRMHCDREGAITISLTPVRFGHPSSTIKNTIDRGTGSHLLQVFVGYGSDIDAEEESTFIDLFAKHCGSSDIVHPGMDREVLVFLTKSVEDTSRICDALRSRLSCGEER